MGFQTNTTNVGQRYITFEISLTVIRVRRYHLEICRIFSHHQDGWNLQHQTNLSPFLGHSCPLCWWVSKPCIIETVMPNTRDMHHYNLAVYTSAHLLIRHVQHHPYFPQCCDQRWYPLWAWKQPRPTIKDRMTTLPLAANPNANHSFFSSLSQDHIRKPFLVKRSCCS